MKKILAAVLSLTVICNCLPLSSGAGEPFAKKRQYYEIRVYNMASADQVSLVEQYVQGALLPALHKADVKTVGVFRWQGNDTAAIKKLFVLIPYKSAEQREKIRVKLRQDPSLQSAVAAYSNVAYNQPAYLRFETILLQAFEYQPQLSVPQLSSARAERVYELRSYEGPSEKIFQTKVEMFNEGGEVTLFKRLGFNAVFYAEVVAGSRMPNLMYMTTFANRASRDEHWKTFGSDPEWKKLSALPKYQHNVSKMDIYFLTPTEYSDL